VEEGEGRLTCRYKYLITTGETMFHNPFNNKFVKDIQNFLNEHRNDVTIDPCLNDHAKKAALWVAEEPLLEERRTILTALFNEAVAECGCRGNSKDIADFTKAVDRYVEEAHAAVVPGKKVTNPPHDKNELETPAAVAGKTAKPTSKANLGKNTGIASTGKNPPKIGG
jgi:hypothetical protein